MSSSRRSEKDCCFDMLSGAFPSEIRRPVVQFGDILDDTELRSRILWLASSVVW